MAQSQTATDHKPVGTGASAARRVARLRRHARLRKKVVGTAERPRLVVNRSSRHIHVQLVNDDNGTTVAAASSIEADVRAVEGDKVDLSVGQRVFHQKFGYGVVKAADDDRLDIDFDKAGEKRVLDRFVEVTADP